MRIVLASSEAVPFSKTGGLADVASGVMGGGCPMDAARVASPGDREHEA